MNTENIAVKFYTNTSLNVDQQKVESLVKYISFDNLPGDCTIGLTITNPTCVKTINVKIGNEIHYTFTEFENSKVNHFFVYKKEFKDLVFVVELKTAPFILPILTIQTGLLSLKDISLLKLKNAKFTHITKTPKETWWKFWG